MSGELFPTLERPWIASPHGPGGTKGTSCVPAGVYTLVRHVSEAFGDVFALTNPALDVFYQDANVPRDRRGLARTAVLIHPANYVTELRGCIAPGLNHARMQGGFMVASSRKALARIRELVPFVDGHRLEIY